MGGIPENDINLKTTVKLALVGLLSSYIAFKVKCTAENTGALENGLC